jgi:hypothetical protein
MSGALTTYSTHLTRGVCAMADNASAADQTSNNLTTVDYHAAGPGRRVLADVAYRLELYGADGLCKWADTFTGTVVTAGLNKLLDATFSSGLTTPLWYIHLLDGASVPVINAADTMSSHAGWAENIGYSQSTCPQFVPGTITAGAVHNSASPATFSLNAPGTIAGAFLCDSNAKPGTTGTLYDVGLFIDGNRSVISGDTLQITVTLSISAA